MENIIPLYLFIIFIYNIQTRRTRSSMIPSPEELVGMFYTKGVTEPLRHLPKKRSNKFPIPKSRPPLTSKPDVVHKILCGSCSWNYIGERGRSLPREKKNNMFGR